MSLAMSLNGHVVSKGTALSLQDRGLHYGDGFFTTLWVTNQQIANWAGHWQRLEQAAKALGFPVLNEQAILEQLKKTVTDVGAEYQQSLRVKILITRGIGGQGYIPASKPNLNTICLVSPVDLPIVKGKVTLLNIGLSPIQWGKQPLLAGIKHLNRLENVLAQQANQVLKTPQAHVSMPKYDECIMQDIEQNIISGMQSAICILHKGIFTTPSIITAGVQSTALAQVARLLSAQGKAMQVEPLTLHDIEMADEVFFCNAIRGIMPVIQYEDSGRIFRFTSSISTQLALDYHAQQMSALVSL